MNQFFIIGNPRSGTSLLRLMLTTHPQIIIPPECHFFLWLEERYSGWDPSWGIKKILNDLFESRKFETWNLDFDELGDAVTKNNVKSFSEFVEFVYIFYGTKAKKTNLSIWGDKNKLWKEKLPSIIKYFPDAKFIHVVRDGRDVASSFKELAAREIKSKYAPKLPTKIDEIAERWRVNVNSIEVFLDNIQKEQVFQVKFENLVYDPSKVLEQVTNFLDIEYDPLMLMYSSTKQHDNYEPKEFMQWKQKLGEPPDINAVGKYKMSLQNFEVDYFNEACKNELTRYGYL